MLRVLVPIEFSLVWIHVFLHELCQLFTHVLHVRRKGLEVNWQETYMEWMEIRECAENLEIKIKMKHQKGDNKIKRSMNYYSRLRWITSDKLETVRLRSSVTKHTVLVR